MDNIETYVTGADLVIGAVLVPGAAAPKLVTRDMLKRMFGRNPHICSSNVANFFPQ